MMNKMASSPEQHEEAQAIHRARLCIEAAIQNRAVNEAIKKICATPHGVACGLALATAATARVWFVHACRFGLLPLATYLWWHFGVDNVYTVRLGLTRAVSGGHVHVIKWIVITYPVDTWLIHCGNIIYTFGNLQLFNTLRWFMGYIDMARQHVYEALHYACKFNCEWFAEWIDSVYHIDAQGIRAYRKKTLATVGMYGHWDLLRWLIDRGDVTDVGLVIDAFVSACSGGHINIVKWLADRFRIQTVRWEDNAALRSICGLGDIDTLRWFIARFGVTARDVRSVGHDLLLEVCRARNFDMAAFLVDRFGLGRDGSRICAGSYIWLLREEWNIDIARWLIDRFGIAHRYASEYPDLVSDLCRRNRLDVLKWFTRSFGVTIDDGCLDTHNWRRTRRMASGATLKWMREWIEEQGGRWPDEAQGGEQPDERPDERPDEEPDEEPDE